jgi:hypothetical protein
MSLGKTMRNLFDFDNILVGLNFSQKLQIKPSTYIFSEGKGAEQIGLRDRVR